jgi:hypothetical protein
MQNAPRTRAPIYFQVALYAIPRGLLPEIFGLPPQNKYRFQFGAAMPPQLLNHPPTVKIKPAP